MRIAIHPDQGNHITSFTKKYCAILEHNNINYAIVNIEESNFWEQIRNYNYFIYRWGHEASEVQRAKSFLPIIEFNLKQKVFPNQNTCWHYDDKIKQYYLARAMGLPIVDSYIFWDKNTALRFIEDCQFPIVQKLYGGAGSSNVLLVNRQEDARKFIETMFKSGVAKYSLSSTIVTRAKIRLRRVLENAGIIPIIKNPYWSIHKDYILFQKYLPNNNYDTRVTTIGNRAFAFIRFVRENDFRASGSGKISYDLNMIDINAVKLALQISKALGFQTMSYDFLYDEDRLVFCEFSYTYLDTAVNACNGYWDDNLNWHEGSFWPQYLQLVDLLEMPELKQPVF